jgi:hypothetical protein
VWLRNAEARAGLPKRGCLHRLRHTFCSSLAAKGVPPTTIQALAGHSDLRTTLRYIHLPQGAKEAAIALLDGPVREGVEEAAELRGRLVDGHFLASVNDVLEEIRVEFLTGA